MIAPPVPHRDIAADIAGEAEARASLGPVCVSVLVASRDPELIAQAAPRLAAELYPEHDIGSVIWHQPHPDPAWTAESRVHTVKRSAGQWSEVAVETRGTTP